MNHRVRAGMIRSFRLRWMRLLLWSWILFSVSLSAQWLSADVKQGNPPNIVVIMVDDMGYGDAACYNSESKIATPNIDQLADDGMRFTDAHAPGPLCHLSRYGLLTGRYPFRTNVARWRRQPSIDEGRLTIASLLKSQGYRTAMVGKWHLGFLEQGYDQPLPGGPVDRGFDSFFGIRASTDIPPYFYIRDRQVVAAPSEHIEARNTKGWSPIQGEFWRAGGIAPDLALKDVLPKFTDEAIRVIEEHSKQPSDPPLFLYLAYPAPHTPWLPSPEFQGISQAGMYGDFVTMTDAMIGRVLKALEDAKMTDDTLLIFTSDNGPVWFEKDVERFGHDSSGGLRGMKADAWENGHRMPFVVRWPGKVDPQTVTDQLVCFTDLLATFAAIVGAELPDEVQHDSVNFLPVLAGTQAESDPVRENLVVASGNGTMTIRDGDWKLITGLGSGGFSKPSRIQPKKDGPTGQLYNLNDDRAEKHNLFLQHPDIVQRLESQLEAIRQKERTP